MMSCVARWSQAQRSPFFLAKAALAISLPGPPRLPLLCLGFPAALQPCRLACGVSATSWQMPQASWPLIITHSLPWLSPRACRIFHVSLCSGWQ